MNQRVRRAKDRKQNISGAVMATGGHVVRHVRGQDPEVRIPQKATGDLPNKVSSGLAKASPFFKKLSEMLPSSKVEEEKAIAESTEEVIETEEKEEEKAE